MEIYEAAASFTTDERFKAWEYASLLTRNEGFRKLEIVSLDAEGKAAAAFTLPMDGNDEAVQGLLGDIMGNGLGALMGVLGEEVPEVMSLIGAFSGDAMAG